jgi:hypothetical protein
MDPAGGMLEKSRQVSLAPAALRPRYSRPAFATDLVDLAMLRTLEELVH